MKTLKKKIKKKLKQLSAFLKELASASSYAINR